MTESSAGPTKHWRRVDAEESHRCSRLGGGGERDAEEQFPRSISRRTREVQEWKKVQRTRNENTSIVTGSKSCPSELLKDSYARALGRLQT